VEGAGEDPAGTLNREGLSAANKRALRDFVDKIVIPPGDGLLRLVGNFGKMFAAASGRNGSDLAAVGNGGCGGVQPAVPAAVERGGITSRSAARPSADLLPSVLRASAKCATKEAVQRLVELNHTRAFALQECLEYCARRNFEPDATT
jgi:hypothetical protein